MEEIRTDVKKTITVKSILTIVGAVAAIACAVLAIVKKNDF